MQQVRKSLDVGLESSEARFLTITVEKTFDDLFSAC